MTPRVSCHCGLAVAALLCALAGCTGNGSPSGPRRLLTPTYSFTAGQILVYSRRNYDWNYNQTSSFQHEVEILASGLAIGGFPDAARARITSTGGGATRIDTVALAAEGRRLMIYDAQTQVPGRFPGLPVWNTLIDLGLNTIPESLVSYDSTFAIAMASGHTLRDRVTCSVGTGYAGEEVISAFGSPLVNCFVFTRTVNFTETVDTAGVLLFRGPAVTLLDSVWFANDIGPVKFTSRGSTLGVDSLGLPFSLSHLQVVHTAASYDSYEVHYARVNGSDELVMRESLYPVPTVVYTVTEAYARNF